MILTIVDISFFPLRLVWVSQSSCTVHARGPSTQPQLFVYVGIFSNTASQEYTAGGKHGVRRWSVSVPFLVFVYRSFPCFSAGQREMNDGWRLSNEESSSSSHRNRLGGSYSGERCVFWNEPVQNDPTSHSSSIFLCYPLEPKLNSVSFIYMNLKCRCSLESGLSSRHISHIYRSILNSNICSGA